MPIELIAAAVPLGIPIIYWIVQRAVDRLEAFISGETQSIKGTLSTHESRLNAHEEALASQNIFNGWIQGRLGLPLEPPTNSDEGIEVRKTG